MKGIRRMILFFSSLGRRKTLYMLIGLLISTLLLIVNLSGSEIAGYLWAIYTTLYMWGLLYIYMAMIWESVTKK